MAAIIRAAFREYHHLFYDLIDRRTDGMFLMYSVWQPLTLVACYLVFCLYLGPKIMKDRPPMKLDLIIKVYNILQIPICLYLVERSLSLGWATHYRWVCEPVDYSETPNALAILHGVWLYTMLKIYDMADTVFFVLRKKQSHVTFLHVYHHAGIFLASWMCTKFLPGGHTTFLGGINCFVHAIMYTYYFITMQWPQYRKNIWWKKHITQLQMAQFLMVTLHSVALLLAQDCHYPKFMGFLGLIQYSFMFFLFLEFYIKAYHKKSA